MAVAVAVALAVAVAVAVTDIAGKEANAAFHPVCTRVESQVIFSRIFALSVSSAPV